MLKVVYCDRPGCGKEVGALRIEDGATVESEFIEGHCTEEVVDEDMHTVKIRHFCSIECCNKSEDFMTPEEVEDE